jgi:general secretion pathway protein A
MDPYRILNLAREPFSNSPDPDFFFESRRHRECLHQLELSVRQRRGLNVVVGDVGTGKTTLCRQLLRRLSADGGATAHLLLDPGFRTAGEALESVLGCIDPDADPPAGEIGFKEAVKSALLRQGVDENRTVVLVIDEGQKIPFFFLEILRELLNFETNRHKLLQIVVFAQPEFEGILRELPNVFDRVGFFYSLGPLSTKEVREMIDYRLKRAGAPRGADAFFSRGAVRAIARASGGFPRRIVDLCHHCLLHMILEDRPAVNGRMVRSRARAGRFFRMASGKRFPGWGLGVAGLAMLVALGVFAFRSADRVSGLESVPPESSSAGAPEPVAEVSGNPAPPEFLGAAALAPGETLGEVARRIYGSARAEIVGAVLDANPHIRSPQRIGAGEPIAFPALFPAADALPPVRVEIERFRRLDRALAGLREFVSGNPEIPVRIFSCWHPEEGVWFALAIDRVFSDVDSARHWLYGVQAESPVPGEVRSEWPPGTVSFGSGTPVAGDAASRTAGGRS